MALISVKLLKTLLFTLLRLTLTLLFILVTPLILTAYAILLLYRLIIFKLAQYHDPSLGKMVSSISNFFAAHDIYGNSYSINVALHIVGRIDRHHVIQGFEKLLETNKTPYGDHQYPELTQKIVKRFGYTFWKSVENFQVDNHVEYLNEVPDAQVTEEMVRGIIAKFGKTPFNPNRSPWMVYVIRNFVSDTNPDVKSAVILRLHHSLFDGQSVLNVFGKMADNGPLVLAGQEEAMAQVEAMNNSGGRLQFLKVILKPIVIFICGPYELIGQLLSYDNNELIQRSWVGFNGVMRFHESERIPLDSLKRVKNHFGVKMSTLLTTLVVRSLKMFMDKREIKADKVHMTFPLPVLNHPDKLRNYFSGGIISFDFRHNDRIKLLHAVEKKFNQFKSAFVLGFPEASMFLLRILGSLPCSLVPKIENVRLSSTLMNSSFPGPIHVGYFYGFPIVDANVGGSFSRPYPISSLSFSYHGFYKFGWMGDTSVLKTQEDIQELGDWTMKELHEFQKKVEEDIA